MALSYNLLLEQLVQSNFHNGDGFLLNQEKISVDN